jgi:hypothetical protein
VAVAGRAEQAGPEPAATLTDPAALGRRTLAVAAAVADSLATVAAAGRPGFLVLPVTLAAVVLVIPARLAVLAVLAQRAALVTAPRQVARELAPHRLP